MKKPSEVFNKTKTERVLSWIDEYLNNCSEHNVKGNYVVLEGFEFELSFSDMRNINSQLKQYGWLIDKKHSLYVLKGLE